MRSSSLSLVLTILGPDRPGLIESIAKLVAQHSGNWEESRMCRLGGKFAGIVQVNIPEEFFSSWEEEVKALQETSDLKVLITQDSEDAENAEPKGKLAIFEIVGQDQPGIIQKITSALTQHHVNVHELTSECTNAPWSGETLFQARAEVQIPSSCQISKLRSDLETIAADLMIDINFD